MGQLQTDLGTTYSVRQKIASEDGPDKVIAGAGTNVPVAGNAVFAAGVGEPAVMTGNQALPLGGTVPRPAPAVPSIYEWQQQRVRSEAF